MTSSLNCLLIMENLFLLPHQALNKRTATIAVSCSEANAAVHMSARLLTGMTGCMVDVAQQEAQLQENKVRSQYQIFAYSKLEVIKLLHTHIPLLHMYKVCCEKVVKK